MTEQHPITPPTELVQQWIQEADGGHDPRWQEYEEDIATRAAQWGADQELEACCDWMSECTVGCPNELRAVRRPKPPSLKEQALEDLEQIDGHAVDQLSAYVIYGDLKRRVSSIRRALEALPDD